MGGGGGILSPITNTLFGSPQEAPAAPDYTSAANATARGNLEMAQAAAAANRVNQITPYGNLTYTESGTDSKGNPMWTATQSLSPAQQQILDLQNSTSIGLGGTINSALGRVQDTMSKDFNPSLPAIQYGGQSPEFGKFGTGPNYQNLTPAQQMQTVGDAEALGRVGQGPAFSQIGNAPNLKTDLASSSGMAGWDRAQNILNQRLQPQLQVQQEQLDTKLRNQGIMPGTEAYNRSKAALGMQQNDLINQSQLTAQGIGQNLYNQDLQTAQFGNTALNQMNQNQLSNLGFNNQAGQQGYTNQLAATQANNAAATQQNQNQLANVGVNNAANQQNYANLQAMLNTNNQNAQQQYANMNTGTSLNNAALQQQFANQQAGANLSNQAQQQAYNQALTQYNMPLNTLSSLRSGSQVQNPSFINAPQQATTAGADLLGAAGMQHNASVAATNAANASQANMNSGLMGLAGTAMMAF